MLRAVATDGHRLARVEMPAPEGRGRHAGHHRAAQGRRRDAEADRGSGAAKSRSSCRQPRSASRFGDVVLTTKLIDGTFPDYGRVIPAGNDKRLIVDRAPFAAAVDRVSTISSERGRAVKLAIADGKLTLSRQQPRFRLGHRGARRRLRRRADRYRLQRPLPARHHRPARQRHGAVQARRSRLADAGAGPRRRGRALCADADAGVNR